MPLAAPSVPFVREIVGGARKRIDGGHVRPRVARQQQRRDREIFVVTPCIADAGGVGVFERGLYHSTSGIPAR